MTHNSVSPLNTGPFFWLMASVFVVALGYGVALPILPFFLKTLLADSARFSVSSHVGMMTGVYAFAMFLFAPLWGRLSDRIGRRPVILVGLGQAIGSVVAGFGFGLMNREPFWASAGLLLIGAAISAGMPLFSAQPASNRGAGL